MMYHLLTPLHKFVGDTPSFLEGKTTYTNAEILTILAGEEWTDPNID